VKTCERCGKLRRDGAWTQSSRATHDSPAEYDWVCEQCFDREDIERDMSIDQSIHGRLDGNDFSWHQGR
jgi:hypothetical protein